MKVKEESTAEVVVSTLGAVLLAAVIVALVVSLGASGAYTFFYANTTESLSGWAQFAVGFTGAYVFLVGLRAVVRGIYRTGKKMGSKK